MAEHNHGAPLTNLQLRVKALEAVLAEKGLVDEATLDALTDHYENKVGPHIGAQAGASWKRLFLHRRDAAIYGANSTGTVFGAYLLRKVAGIAN
jgi:hypothetical protein